MKHLQKAKSAKRIGLAGRFHSRSGQQEAKCLKPIERALIRYFLSERHNLVASRARVSVVMKSLLKANIPRSLFRVLCSWIKEKASSARSYCLVLVPVCKMMTVRF
jgi:hypothetical protein